MVFQGISGAFLYFLVQFGNFGAFFELFGNFGKLWILLHTQSISSNDDDLPDLIDPSLVNVYEY